MSNVIIRHGALARLGFSLNKQLLNTRVLAGSIAAISLTSISTIFNYQFGAMLASDDEISQKLLPIGYACLDVAALFIGGYIGLYARRYWSKLVGGIWLSLLITLSLFTAWSYQCATDHSKLNVGINQQILSAKQDIERYTLQYTQAMREKSNTKYHTQKTKYQNEADHANELLEQQQAELAALQAKDVPREYAVFYRTPILRESPQTFITIVRFIFSSAIIFTPFVILYLMGIESGTTPQISAAKTAKKKSLFSRFRLPRRSAASVGDISVARGQGSDIAAVEPRLYERIKRDIINGKVKPSCRAIDKKYTISSRVRTAILARLKDEKIINLKGNGYVLNTQEKPLNVVSIR